MARLFCNQKPPGEEQDPAAFGLLKYNPMYLKRILCNYSIRRVTGGDNPQEYAETAKSCCKDSPPVLH